MLQFNLPKNPNANQPCSLLHAKSSCADYRLPLQAVWMWVFPFLILGLSVFRFSPCGECIFCSLFHPSEGVPSRGLLHPRAEGSRAHPGPGALNRVVWGNTTAVAKATEIIFKPMTKGWKFFPFSLPFFLCRYRPHATGRGTHFSVYPSLLPLPPSPLCIHTPRSCPVLCHCLSTNQAVMLLKMGWFTEGNENNAKDNNEQIEEMKELRRTKAQAGFCAIIHGSLPLSESHKCWGLFCFFFPSLLFFFFLYSFSKPKLKENNPQNRASMYMFVHVLEKKKKKNTTKNPGHCVSEKGSVADQQGFIILSSIQSNVALWTESNVGESSWGLFFCVWVVSICQLSMPVRDIQGCHFSSASICEVFCSCYTTHTVLIEGQQRSQRRLCCGWSERQKRDVRVVLG